MGVAQQALTSATGGCVVVAFLVAVSVVAAEVPTLLEVVAGEPRDFSTRFLRQAILRVLQSSAGCTAD